MRRAHDRKKNRPSRKLMREPIAHPALKMIAPGRMPKMAPAAKFRGVVVIKALTVRTTVSANSTVADVAGGRPSIQATVEVIHAERASSTIFFCGKVKLTERIRVFPRN